MIDSTQIEKVEGVARQILEKWLKDAKTEPLSSTKQAYLIGACKVALNLWDARGSTGLTEKRLREALEEARAKCCGECNRAWKWGHTVVATLDKTGKVWIHGTDEPGHFSLCDSPAAVNKALALPKTQAEKEISKIAERIHDAENQIQWCHDKLGTNLNGDDMATVRITLIQALRELQAARKEGLE